MRPTGDRRRTTFGGPGLTELVAQILNIRAVGERAIATLKTWRPSNELCCCPRRATTIPQGHPRAASQTPVGAAAEAVNPNAA